MNRAKLKKKLLKFWSFLNKFFRWVEDKPFLNFLIKEIVKFLIWAIKK